MPQYDYLRYGFGRPFKEQATPGDLRSLTGGAIDPVGNIKTGARQAAGKKTDGVELIFKRLLDFPKTRITKDIRIFPMLTPTDLEQEYLNELNKKQIML